MPAPAAHPSLSSRDIIGLLRNAYESKMGASLINQVAMFTPSDKASETYKWLGNSPTMREWVGARLAKGLRENGFTIENKKFESTLQFALDDLRRDKYSLIQSRINELAQVASDHPVKLLSELVLAGTAATCYDGQYFFDTDHVEGDSGSQSNILNITIASLPVSNHGVTTAPSAEEMAEAILRGIQKFFTFVDDQGEPRNGTARSFLVHCPVGLMSAVSKAINMSTFGGGATNPLSNDSSISVSYVPDPRLTWTDKFAIYRTDGMTKPFIYQVEKEVSFSAQAEGSPLEFYEAMHAYGLDSIYNVGYGLWYNAVLVDLD